ncbi:O-antigen ligase family protein [Novosphingobium sp. RD2P27]|uniref:O-antigen ligase family protein n=1 Tax=Novosphingobium kalidii TaxID=3230299 RepID=A0ABV2D4C7_9SPHN
MSAFWSDSFSTTLNAALALILLVLTGFLIGVRLPLHLAARALIHSGAIMAVASVLMWLLYPAYGAHQAGDASQAVHAGAWRGVYLHKNHFGPLCAIYLSAVLLASRRVLPSQAYRWGLAAFLSFLIIQSWSASAIALVPLALFLTWLVVVLNPAEKLLAGSAAALGGMAAVLSAGVLLASLGRDATLTGRTEIWQTALTYIVREPLIGYGFGSGVYAGFVVEVGRLHGVHDAHNGYLDLLLGAGVIGLALFLAAVVAAWIIARGVYSFGGSYGAGALVLAAVLDGFLIAGLTEANVRPLSAVAGLAFCALGILLSAPRPKKISPTGSHAIRQERLAPRETADGGTESTAVGA